MSEVEVMNATGTCTNTTCSAKCEHALLTKSHGLVCELDFPPYAGASSQLPKLSWRKLNELWVESVRQREQTHELFVLSEAFREKETK